MRLVLRSAGFGLLCLSLLGRAAQAQRPTVDVGFGVGIAFGGAGPIANAAILPVRVRVSQGLEVGLGVGGWYGRLANDDYEDSHRNLYGGGPRAEARIQLADGSIAPYIRAEYDWVKSEVMNAFFIIGQPAPGQIWDRSNGKGTSVGAEVGVSVRLRQRLLLNLSAARDDQELYAAGTNTLWRFAVGVGTRL